jgi:hypothetical protein
MSARLLIRMKVVFLAHKYEQKQLKFYRRKLKNCINNI